jgi:hypothetical protein
LGSEVAANKAVSFAVDGTIQTGAGTTIYRNLGTLSNTCPKYLKVNALFEEEFLVTNSHYSGSSKYSMQVVKVDPVTKNATSMNSLSASASALLDLYGVEVLNQDTGLFITISQNNFDTSSQTAQVAAGKVDRSSGYAITLGAGTIYSDYSYSLQPVITRLSNTTFAIGYYYGKGSALTTQYGEAEK